MRLQEIMNTEVVTIGPDDVASTAWARMQRKRIRHLVVTRGTRLLGVLSERDLGRRVGSLPVMEGGRVVGIVTATDVLDELGRGSSRPAVRAQRRSMRLPPVATRRKAAKPARLS